jgi:hypothetical protein
MATQYTGDRTTIEIPAAKPNDGVSPIGVMPDDGDDLNASSVLQPFKVCLDFIDYCTHRFETFPGVRDYEAARTYTAGMMCLSTDGMTYRVKAGQTSTNVVPQTDTAKWERWGYTKTELWTDYAVVGNASAGVWKGPGIWIQWHALTFADAQIPANGNSKTHTFLYEFPTACMFAGFFVTGLLSDGDRTSLPQIFAGSATKTQCTLVAPTMSGTGDVSTGYLSALGN